MKPQQFIKALIAGLAFPAIFLPILYSLLYFIQPEHYVSYTHLQFIPLFMPLIFGVANIFYVRIADKFPTKQRDNILIITGVILGLIVAICHVPTFIFGVFAGFGHTEFIVLPVVYALIFRFVIKWLNHLLGVK